MHAVTCGAGSARQRDRATELANAKMRAHVCPRHVYEPIPLRRASACALCRGGSLSIRRASTRWSRRPRCTVVDGSTDQWVSSLPVSQYCSWPAGACAWSCSHRMVMIHPSIHQDRQSPMHPSRRLGCSQHVKYSYVVRTPHGRVHADREMYELSTREGSCIRAGSRPTCPTRMRGRWHARPGAAAYGRTSCLPMPCKARHPGWSLPVP